jgi:tetratricopeptide (TPR) repeat protein
MRSVLRGLAAATVVSAYALAADMPVSVSPDEGWPIGERVLSKYKAGKQKEVVVEGEAALAKEPWNNELRYAYANSLLWNGREWDATPQYRMLLETEYAVDARLGLANSLAWTGRMTEALPHYQMIVNDPKVGGEARLGMANVYLWLGRADLALPIYKQLRADYPTQDTGEEGLYYARRATRAHTTFGDTYTRDNTPTRRNEPWASHTWRDESNAWIFGLYGNVGHDWNPNLNRDLDRREYGVSVENVDWALAPRLSVSRQQDPQGLTFGELRIQAISSWPLYVSAGRVNWGKLSFTVPALGKGLTANHAGLEGRYNTYAGELRGFANYWDVSDGNKVENAELRLTSRWRPFGQEIRPFIGTHWRGADQTVPDYWSPEKYWLGFAGVEWAWERRYWSITGLAQVGFKIAGDASTAWSVALAGKRWIGDDWAIGVSGYAISGTRQVGYKSEGATVTLEKLW